jgi:serine/threonine protein kinase
MQKHTTLAGSPLWLAPEVIEGRQGYDEHADIWSLGVTTLELAFGHPPHDRCTPLKAMMLIVESDAPTVANTRCYAADCSHVFSSAFHAFVAACLVKNPSARPSAKQLLEHKFLNKVSDSLDTQRQLLVARLVVSPAVLALLTSPTVHSSPDEGEEDNEACASTSSWSWASARDSNDDNEVDKEDQSYSQTPRFYDDDEPKSLGGK